MKVFFLILKILGYVILFAFVLYLLYVLIKIISVILSDFKKYKKVRKRYLHILWLLRKTRFDNATEFIKWVLIDIFRGKVKVKLFGIWCFTGYFGEGKTLGAVNYALNIRNNFSKVGKKVHIYTNFKMRGQDGKITSWEDLLNLPKTTIVIFDEIQSTFTSQKFKDFPIELLWKITQCRKQELCIFASSPVFTRMAIQLKENTDFVIECHNLLSLDRWFSYKFYRAPDYERYMDNPIKLMTAKKWTYTLVAQDYNYRAYNTHEIVDRLDILPQKH